MLEDLFSEMDLCILNDGSSTYIHPATGSTSALDLSICGPSLVLDYEWNIHEASVDHPLHRFTQTTG